MEFFVSTCADQTVLRETINCIERLKEHHDFKWTTHHGGGPCRPKNVGVTEFLLEDDSPYFISIDRDILFTPDDIDKLLGALETNELVGGCYVVRDGSDLACSSPPTKQTPSPIDLDGGLHEVKFMSTGFMGVRRELFERVIRELELPLLTIAKKPAYPFFEDRAYHDPDWGWMWLSEDYEFSRKARLVGAIPMLHTGIRVGHIGTITWTVDSMIARRAVEAYFKAKAEAH